MKTLIHTLIATLGVAVLAGFFPSMATAGCGADSPLVQPSSWHPLYPGTNIPMGQPIGTLHIKAKVTLAPDGQSFTGTFTQILYDTSGNQAPGSKQEGIYTGTRINVNTPVSSIL